MATILCSVVIVYHLASTNRIELIAGVETHLIRSQQGLEANEVLGKAVQVKAVLLLKLNILPAEVMFIID